MSLTSEMTRKGSPVAEYLRFVGAVIAGAARGNPLADGCKQILGVSSLDVPTVVAPVDGANARTVGTAFDYRLRYHLAPCDPTEFVAFQGARMYLSSNPFERAEISRFFENLILLTNRLSPAQDLSETDELLLATYCVVLQQLESVYRSSGQWKPVLPLPAPGDPGPEDEPLLALAAAADVQDVMNLAQSAGHVFRPLIDLVAGGRVAYHPNPVFAGSVAIGGADADFVIGDGIFELKTLGKLDASAVRSALLQLVGYALLDYDDRHEIRQVGLYASRQEWVAMWPLWQLVFPLSDVVQRLNSGTQPVEAEITERLALLRSLMQTVVEGGSIDYATAFA